MMTRGKWFALLGAGGVVLLGAAGCTSTGSSYADLSGDPGPGDALPASLTSGEFGGELDLNSARSVGEHNGAQLWLVEGSERNQICLVAYVDGGGYSSCAAAGALLEMGLPASEFLVAPDTAGTPEGAVAISSNVYAKTS